MDYETLRAEVHDGQAVKLSGGVLMGDEYTIQRADGAIWTLRRGQPCELWSLTAHEVVATFQKDTAWNWRHLNWAALAQYIEGARAVDAVETMLGVLR